MKYDYDGLNTYQILRIYRQELGHHYRIDFSDEPDDFREDIINCIETGTPQEFKPPVRSKALRDLTPGVDYAL